METGQCVDERYELEELLGAGGMASVFRAHDTRLERSVAVKILDEELASDPEYMERFRREAQTMARLAHPNIVTVIDSGEVDGRQYLVLEHVAGETLKDVIQSGSQIPLERALALAHQVGRGLAFAHAHGVVHRDVKPQNVLVDERGTPKVTDFGIARSLGGADAADGLTKTGTILGTSEYIAPEQVLGTGVDARSDQYSLGVLLYELLTGQPPFPGATFMQVATRHVSDPVPSVRALRPDVPRRVDAVVQRAMAKRPEDRFPSLEAMIGALEVCLAVERGRASRPQRAFRRGRPSPPVLRLSWTRLAAAGAVLAAAILALTIGLAGGDDDDPDTAKGTAPSGPRLRAVRDHDPFGDDREEHGDEVRFATDGDRSTYWTTERYSSFQKPGVGIVLDAGRPTELAFLEVASDEPGFRAKVRAGNAPAGGFKDVSGERTVGARTRFQIDSGEDEFRYYLLWITDPNGRAHVNEVRAG